MIDWLLQIASNIEMPWAVFFLSMLPVTELRVAIPLGLAGGMSAPAVFTCAIAGNFVPVIPLMLLLSFILRLLARCRLCHGLLRRLNAAADRHEPRIRRYGLPGLILLVAIPLPGTGVWTGCLVATLLRLPAARAVVAIAAGEIAAGMMVTAVSGGVMAVGSMIYGEYILLALAILLLLIFIVRRRKSK